nr:hypothetical protein [Tanacetum cinerariifolium]
MVILLLPQRVVDGVLQPVAPTTAEQSTESLDQIQDRLQKLIGQLEILGVSLSQEDIKLKFLRSLPSDWRTHTLIWRNKTDLEEQSLDDLFNRLKIYEAEVKSSSTESLDQIQDRLQKLIGQLEILGVSLSQEDIKLKFLRSLPSDWRTHTLIWRNKTDLEEQSLDDLFNRLKIYEAEVKSSSSASTTTQNIAFVSLSNTDSTNEPVSAASSVSAVSAKLHVSTLPNVYSLSNAVIYLFFASQSSSPHLDNDDLKQIDADHLEEMDLKWQMAMLTVECNNCYRKRHFARECRSPKDARRNGAAEPQRMSVPVETTTSNALVSQCDGVGSYDWSFQAEEEPTNYALMAFSSSSSSSDNKVVSYSKAYAKAYAQLQSHYDKLTADFRKSQFDVISYQIGLESVEARLLVYQQNEFVFEKDINLLKLEVQLRDNALVRSDESLPPSPIYDRYQSGNRPLAPIIEDWVSDSEDESETKAPQKVPSFVQSIEQVKSPRPSDQHVETSIPAATPKSASPKPTRNGKHRNRKVCFVCKSLDHLIKDCDYHEKKMAQPTARNLAHRGNHTQYAQMPLSNPQRHVVPAVVLTQSRPVPIPAVRPVSTVVPKIKSIGPATSLPHEQHNNSLKPFTKEEEIDQQYVIFPVWSTGFTNPHNTDGDAAFDEKEFEFDAKKPESEVNVSPSSSTQSKKHDDKTKREAKGKIPGVGQISSNNTNTFSAAGPANAAASPTQGKYSCIDTSQLLDDPYMPELEDITYSDDEDDVGAEADFNNLETSITVSPILTTRVYKDHLVT